MNKIVDFYYMKKLEILAEMTTIFSRLALHNGNYEEMLRFCEELLIKPLGPNHRKEIERLRGAALAARGSAAPAAKGTA
eukprot:CAMPEP_0168313252 /NCGR_PEP_ID=MMETSP0210-20121227/646_1 /TAXON_ID=40633 /ORGANISM="Condylostoma magnum, Strain COL2" /LENGTH=78 /DNA_ID=CAMNT_0008267405 /DNA_START=2224 /DNA_END=2460 /DNA_ORIENTATION=-